MRDKLWLSLSISAHCHSSEIVSSPFWCIPPSWNPSSKTFHPPFLVAFFSGWYFFYVFWIYFLNVRNCGCKFMLNKNSYDSFLDGPTKGKILETLKQVRKKFAILHRNNPLSLYLLPFLKYFYLPLIGILKIPIPLPKEPVRTTPWAEISKLHGRDRLNNNFQPK